MLNKQSLYIFSITLLLFLWGGERSFSQVATQNNYRPSLTAYLKKLNVKYNTRISFSSTFTDNIHPRTKVSTGTLEGDLEKLLEGTNLKYKVVDEYYYIYKVKDQVVSTPVKAIPLQKSEERKPLPPVSAVPQRITFPKQNINTPLKLYFSVVNPLQMESPKLAVKTNLLYDITATVNLGIEFAIANKWTMDISGNWNFWNFSSGTRKWKQAIIQPELRYWLCERFNGHFVGVHLHTGLFNIGALPAIAGVVSKNMQQYRYQGYLYGGGFTYGYHTILSNRWSLETSIGLGYAHIKYDKYPCGNCGSKIKNNSKNYFGPTKASISLIYNIK